MHHIISELNVIIKNISKIYNSAVDKKIYITHCRVVGNIRSNIYSYTMKNICGLNPYYFYIINKLYTTYGIEPIFLKAPCILGTLDNSIIDLNANINTELETIYVFPFITTIEDDKSFLELQECYYFTEIILENDVYIKHNWVFHIMMIIIISMHIMMIIPHQIIAFLHNIWRHHNLKI